MPKQKIDDIIDFELSRTYFGNSTGKKEPHKIKKKPGVLKSSIHLKQLLTITFALGLLAFLGICFYLEKSAKTCSIDDKKTLELPAREPSGSFKTFYDFEDSKNGWEIPLWAMNKPDHVATSLRQTKVNASSGNSSLELCANFPGGRWTAALVEIAHYLDLGMYNAISADIYLPPECPGRLKTKIILTVGEDWRFIEMSRSVYLKPGKWTRIVANISEGSRDWRRTMVDDEFKTDIRKIAIRIESDKRPVYSGPIYIDNIRFWGNEV